MRIEIICSDPAHPVWPHLQAWAEAARARHEVSVVSSSRDLVGGDLLFLVSCSEIIGAAVRERFGRTLVLHASDLPEGRGWSPYIWQILEGRGELCVTLIEAADPVDTGAILAQTKVTLQGHELLDEIHESLFAAELHLMTEAVDRSETIIPRPQSDRPASYYRRRTREDSRLDPSLSLAEQFDLLRVCDPDRYPAFFELCGHRYVLRITKASEEPS